MIPTKTDVTKVIKVMISIPENEYNAIRQYDVEPVSPYIKYIRDGVVLPEGHGDLKDIGNLKYVFDLTKEEPVYSGKDIERAIKSMTTIVEADKTERSKPERDMDR